MKRISILLLLISIHFSSRAQQWAWVSAAATGSLTVSAPGVVATGKDAVMWGTLVEKEQVFGSEVFGKYAIAEHDTAGNPGAAITISGSVLLLDAHTDAAGNYYVLGKVLDTATFSSGFQTTRNALEPNYFLCRLDKGTLALSWFKYLGIDDNSYANTFAVKNDGVYIFVDTAFTVNVLYRYDLATGTPTHILTQNNTGLVTSLQVDDAGNIYVAGSGVSIFNADFNGHLVTIPVTNPYPAYIVRYKPGGVYDWSTIITDITVVRRQLSISSNNSIYYSGPVHDTFTLGGFNLHHPIWVYDFMVSRMDSTGNVHWVRQLPDTMGGDAMVRNEYHAVAMSNGSLCVGAGARYYTRWGNGVVTDNGTNDAATVVNYTANGTVNWALPVVADYSVPGTLGTDGQNIWFTATGFDSTALHFGSLTIPTTYYNYKTFLAKIRPGVPPVTGVANCIEGLFLSVFPNPASDRIYVQSNSQRPAMITITNVAGKVMSRKATNGQVNESIDITSWPAGVYFAEVASGGERFMQKVVVQ